MADTEAIKQAVQAFHNLSGDDTAKLVELNTRIQSHTGKWGVNATPDANGVLKMPLVRDDPLIYEFIDFMHDSILPTPMFDWVKWSEGSELFMSKKPNRYDNVDVETALKLIYAVTRKERFADGTLALAFETGFPKLVNRLVELKVSGIKS